MSRRPSEVDRLSDRITPETELLAEGKEPPHHASVTDAVDEAAETGIDPIDLVDEQIPGDDDALRGGDPDADPLLNQFSGEEAAGGPNASPDGNDVDAIGRLAGVSEADRSGLVLGDDLIAPRDRARWENDPDSKDEEK